MMLPSSGSSTLLGLHDWWWWRHDTPQKQK